MGEEVTSSHIRPLCIPILGMHRSGTSALTRVVNLLGASLGGNLMGATPTNTRGHWERLDIYDLHESILREFGTTWDDCRPLAIDPGVEPVRSTWRPSLAHLLKTEFAGTQLFTVKDPRTCRLLPLWKAAVEDAGFEMRPMLIVRHPLEVATSLDRRSPMRKDQALRAWLTHVLESERQTRDLRRAFITYEDLITDWFRTMSGVAKQLSLTWPRIDSPITQRVIELFVNPSDRHHVFSLNRPAADALEETAIQVYGIFSEASKNGAGALIDPVAFVELSAASQTHMASLAYDE